MDPQHIIDILIAIVIGGLGWWINNMWTMLRSMQEQISGLNVKLGEQYVPRVELQATFEKIFDKLDEMSKEISHISKNQAHVRGLQEAMRKDSK